MLTVTAFLIYKSKRGCSNITEVFLSTLNFFCILLFRQITSHMSQIDVALMLFESKRCVV